MSGKDDTYYVVNYDVQQLAELHVEKDTEIAQLKSTNKTYLDLLNSIVGVFNNPYEDKLKEIDIILKDWNNL